MGSRFLGTKVFVDLIVLKEIEICHFCVQMLYESINSLLDTLDYTKMITKKFLLHFESWYISLCRKK